MQNVKLVLVGDGGVGKTCSLISFTTNAFPSDYVPTVFDDYSANIMIDGMPVQIGFWDTAGQSDYDRLRPLSYPQTDVFLICYSVGNRDSFENIATKWIPEVKHHCPGVPYFIIGFKSDLFNDDSIKDKSNLVTYKETEQFSNKNGAAGFAQCSSLTQDKLKESFEMAIRGALYKGKNKSKNCTLL